MPSQSSLQFVLASASPRRQEMLRSAGLQFIVDPAHIAEEQQAGEPPLEFVCRLAREKAEAVAARHPGHVVVGADTIVVIEGEVLGKPADEADAQRMLRLLSGTTHEVTTAVCLVLPGNGAQVRHETTRVHMRAIAEAEMLRYIRTGEPMDKAGGYGIQGGAGAFVDRIEGDYANVVGLPGWVPEWVRERAQVAL